MRSSCDPQKLFLPKRLEKKWVWRSEVPAWYWSIIKWILKTSLYFYIKFSVGTRSLLSQRPKVEIRTPTNYSGKRWVNDAPTTSHMEILGLSFSWTALRVSLGYSQCPPKKQICLYSLTMGVSHQKGQEACSCSFHEVGCSQLSQSGTRFLKSCWPLVYSGIPLTWKKKKKPLAFEKTELFPDYAIKLIIHMEII